MAEKGLGNTELAEATGIAPSTITRLQNSDRLGTIAGSTINALCLALNCTPNDLMVVVCDREAPPQQEKPEVSRSPQIAIPGSNLTLEFVPVEGGTFQMGSIERSEEKPVRSVSVPGFSIGKYLITQEQYEAVMGDNPSHFKGANRPADSVSWYKAEEFCQKLSELTGEPICLPTEAQWEYAARGGDRSQNYRYAGSNDLDEVGWYKDNSDGQNHEVGQKKPNELGIYDMSGNLWEWCVDDWNPNYKEASSDGSPWRSPDGDPRKTLRGGAWYSIPKYCRFTMRDTTYPEDRCNDFGLRVVLLPKTQIDK